MAEIIILIIFVLLLALATILSREHEKRKEIERQLHQAEQRIAELSEQVAVLNKAAGGKDISEIVRELVAARGALKQASTLQARLEEAREQIENFEEAAKSAGVEPNPENVSQALQEGKQSAEAIKQIAGKSGVEVAKENVALRTEKARLEGQLANSQKKLVSLGKGNEMPSCWAVNAGVKTHHWPE